MQAMLPDVQLFLATRVWNLPCSMQACPRCCNAHLKAPQLQKSLQRQHLRLRARQILLIRKLCGTILLALALRWHRAVARGSCLRRLRAVSSGIAVLRRDLPPTSQAVASPVPRPHVTQRAFGPCARLALEI
eukprot:361399-Chlamydomonas_euryale.AAC.6